MALVCAVAFCIALLALRGLEGPEAQVAPEASPPPFVQALRQVWGEPEARRFTIFIFVSMLAYSAQDLILEPFAGSVFGFTPGQSTGLSGVQHGGVLAGMILVALAGSPLLRGRVGSLRSWAVGGCLMSALALASLALAGAVGPQWPFRGTVFALGVANGAFSIAAIGSMMRLAGHGRERREGVRMGLWGAAQAVAFGLGGLIGTAASDLAQWLIGSPGPAYACVFALEALLFVVSAWLAAHLDTPGAARVPTLHPTAGRRAEVMS
jgi:BCD family chlorophyll transporter-like MFS transporter